jgi:hypothetical protein
MIYNVLPFLIIYGWYGPFYPRFQGNVTSGEENIIFDTWVFRSLIPNCTRTSEGGFYWKLLCCEDEIYYVSIECKINSVLYNNNAHFTKRGCKTINTSLYWSELQSQQSERSCTCVLGDSASYYDFSIGFWNFSDSVVLLFFSLYLDKFELAFQIHLPAMTFPNIMFR